VRSVGDPSFDRGELGVAALDLFFESADLLLQRLHLRQRLGRRPSADGGQLVSPAAFLLQSRDRLAASPVELSETLQTGCGIALGELAEQVLRMLAQKLAW
jgi:hypothetical protein